VRLLLDDPHSIAVEGVATLTGFDPDDPLHGLEGLTLRLGISPEQIYFGLEASGEPIPLPPVGRYVNGRVSVSQLTIGYGFTRNSLAVSFAGELVYPEHLTEDIDTSRAIGFGIKLPRYNRIAFQLDMIPVPGPIPVVPACQFALDLRTPGLPALANTQVCEPVFDGLELHVPGVIHADVKALSASPLFGVIPAVNARFDGDVDLGNKQFGFTIVCDDLLWLAGIGTFPNSFPIPLLIDPRRRISSIYAGTCCAGFGINFDVERPFPLPNPLIVFEALALIADPLHPIDPDGPLARSIRIALRDAYISIPRWAQRLIPGGAEIVRNEINVELNVGTLVAAVQWFARTLPPVLARTQDAFAAGAAAVRDLATNPPRIDPGELLALLPARLGKAGCELAWTGVAASTTVVLIAPDANTAMRGRLERSGAFTCAQRIQSAGFGRAARAPSEHCRRFSDRLHRAAERRELPLLRAARRRRQLCAAHRSRHRAARARDQRLERYAAVPIRRSPAARRRNHRAATLRRNPRPRQWQLEYRARGVARCRGRAQAGRAAPELEWTVCPLGRR
jgi:hypothetical protein